LKLVRACKCQEEGKDGCYECLFAYRNSFDQDKTSRKKAQNLLSAIAKHWSQLEETSQGLTAIRLDSNFESELERRFIEAIRRYKPTSDNSQPLTLRKDTFNGKTGYYLKIGEAAWIIETQVTLGDSEGVAIPSRADFLIRSASRLDSKPIAIFTDGWEYHKDRIWEDFQQRLAILRSNQYWCWSLTWEDVAKQLDPDHLVNWSDGLNCQLNGQFQANRQQIYQQYQCSGMAELEDANSFEWLMHYLANPSANLWQRWGLLRTLAQAHPQSFVDKTFQQLWGDQVTPIIGNTALDFWAPPSQFINGEIPVSQPLKVWSAADLRRHQQQDPTGSLVLLQVDDAPSPNSEQLKNGWNEALRLLNLYQFLPHVYAITTTAVAQGSQPLLADPPTSRTSSVRIESASNERWSSLREIILEDVLLPAINQMSQENWPLPEVGYELTGERGKVIAEAELAWPEAKVAILATTNDQDACSQIGWFTLTIEAFLQSPATIKAKLQGA
jgi:DEAD/DEAH box helicase domain-containing protein